TKLSNEQIFFTDQQNFPRTKKPDYLANFLNQTFENPQATIYAKPHFVLKAKTKVLSRPAFFSELT
ncbi:MAG: hypothetical protein ACT6FF_06625, partial [Methanosarcinaceae archaeon]